MSDRDNSRELRDDIQIVSNDIVGRTRELVQAGNSRTFILRNRDGNQLVSTTMTIAAAIGGIAILFYLPIAIILVVAAVVLRLQIEILHEVEEEEEEVVDTPTVLIDTSDDVAAAKPASPRRKRRSRIADE